MSSQDAIATALEVERLKRQKSVQAYNEECQREVSAIIEDQNRRGLRQSGMTGTRLVKAYRNRIEKIVTNAIELRRESLQRAPELGSGEWLGKLKAELEQAVEVGVKGAYQQISARVGGLIQLDDPTFMDSETERRLKGFATREIEILRQESKMLNTSREAGSTPSADPRNVFVVHGRNLKARDAIFRFLRSLDLSPIEWAQAVSLTGKGSPYIGEILDHAFSQAAAVVVLITGDDVARLRKTFQERHDPQHETTLTPQARPNVLFEAGMAFGRHPDRTILVALGDSRPFSDVAGRNQVKISNRPQDRQELAGRLRTAGCAVNTTGPAWISEGDFDAALVLPDDDGLQESREVTVPANLPPIPAIGANARVLLMEAVQDRQGLVMNLMNMSGPVVQTNNRGFIELGDPRSGAVWRGAVDELLRAGLLEDRGGDRELFHLTGEGYRVAEMLAQSAAQASI